VGLLKHLLFWPVTGPLFLMDFSLGKVDGVVREELTSDAPIKSDLLELQLQVELDEVDDQEYARREAELMQRLRDVRTWRERLGMGVSGGPVRMAGSGPDEAADEPPGEDAAGADAEGGDDDRSPRVASPGEASVDVDFGHE